MIILVVPKLAPGIATNIIPSDDLFINQQGLPYSPEKNTWSYTDCEFAQVNNRRYTVLQDTTFTLGAPFSVDWAENGADEQNAYWRQDLKMGNKPSSKKWITKHQLGDINSWPKSES